MVYTRPLPILLRALFVIGMAAALLVPAQAQAQAKRPRVSEDLAQLVKEGDVAESRVIVTGTTAEVDAIVARYGLRVRKRLQTGAVVDVPRGALGAMTDDTAIDHLAIDQVVKSHMAVTNASIGADLVQSGAWAAGAQALTGAGVGVAVLDSGVANVPELKGRVVASVDLTDDRGTGQDHFGHGTHLAGMIAAAGSGKDADTVGVAPGAAIINVKVLGADGAGYASDVIRGIDWVIANRLKFNIRVINLSLGAPVRQSWRDDPLCQAVERAHRAGIVVVAASGNAGRTADGKTLYGGVTTPGNSPHAITVGAINTKGTPWRSDDVMATYSSRGPTRFDHLIKPDLVAPGNRILGILAPGAKLATEHPELVMGSGAQRKLELSGTSMSAAVVSGAVALLIEGRQEFLSPEAVRFALQSIFAAIHK